MTTRYLCGKWKPRRNTGYDTTTIIISNKRWAVKRVGRDEPRVRILLQKKVKMLTLILNPRGWRWRKFHSAAPQATSPPVTMMNFNRTNDRSSLLSSSSIKNNNNYNNNNNNNNNNNIPLSARIKVKHFTNQTEQWGLDYALTDDSFGAIFNDESRAVLTKCGKCVFYWPNVPMTSTNSSAEKRISPRKKFSSKKCIAGVSSPRAKRQRR